MSFVEDNSLCNVLRYARMMHGDSFLDQAGPGISLSHTRTAPCHWPVVSNRVLPTDPPTCLGVISKYITQGWGRLNFNGFIFGEAGNRSLSDKPNGPDRHLCQMRGPVLSCDHSGDKLHNRATLGRVPDHMRHTGDLQLCANTRHVLFQAWTSLSDSRCQGQGRLYTLTI